MSTTTERLALEGGEKTVTAPMNDRWVQISEQEIEAVTALMRAGDDLYSIIPRFEIAFREFVGTRYALAHCNGTAALHAAVFAAGVRQGDEVITPSYTWHASISPILHCMGTPIFCDVDARTFCADPADIRRKVTDRTKAIIVTHVFGNPAKMDEIMVLAGEHNLIVIEDASHAHGATFGGRQVGSMGHIGCFSMQASKAVSAIEGGVATTNDTDLYERMLILGHYGRVAYNLVTDKYRPLHNIGLGVKYRANPLALAMAEVQLARLPELNEKRAAWFAYLDRELGEIPGLYPQATYPHAKRGGMLLYTGLIEPAETGVSTDRFLKALVAEGVPTQPGITPFGYGKMHLEPLFTDFPFEGLGGPWGSPGGDTRKVFPRGSLPVSEKLAENVFWLSTPVDPDPAWLEQVAAAFRKVRANVDRLKEL